MDEDGAQVDWAALSHAYGSAEDVPGILAALTDPERVDGAVDCLWGGLLHQESIYSATGPAMAAAARILASGRCADPRALGEVLLDFACIVDGWAEDAAGDESRLYEETEHVPACRRALGEAARALLPALDGCGAVARTAAALQPHHPGPYGPVVRALRARLAREADDVGLLAAFSLGRLGAESESTGGPESPDGPESPGGPESPDGPAAAQARDLGRLVRGSLDEERIPALAAHWPQLRGILEAAAGEEGPGPWLARSNPEGALALLSAVPGPDAGVLSGLVEIVTTSRRWGPPAADRIVEAALEPGCRIGVDDRIRALRQLPPSARVCDALALAAGRTRGIPAGPGHRVDLRATAALALLRAGDPRWSGILAEYLGGATTDSAPALMVMTSSHGGSDLAAPFLRAGAGPLPEVVDAVRRALGACGPGAGAACLLRLLAGWPARECAGALPLVRSLLPDEPAAVVTLAAWKDTADVPGMRAAARRPDAPPAVLSALAALTGELADYHRILDANPGAVCADGLARFPRDARLLERCEGLVREPATSLYGCWARLDAARALVGVGRPAGPLLPLVVEAIERWGASARAGELLGRWREAGLVSAEDCAPALAALRRLAENEALGTALEIEDRLHAALALVRLTDAWPGAPQTLARLLGRGLGSRADLAVELARTAVGAPAAQRAAVERVLRAETSRDRRPPSRGDRAIDDERALARMRGLTALLADPAEERGRP